MLSMTGITKRFLGVAALLDAELDVAAGEVHALVGQNGAGKSTLIKVLTGAYQRDAGEIVFDGERVNFGSPHAAQLRGLSTIYQEVNLVRYRSVAENIFLGREPKGFGVIDWRRMHREGAALMQRLGLAIDVTRPLYEYSLATQQMTAIARALSTEAKLVIMDEPTSALADQEVQTLFGVIRQLKEDGIAVVFVSHRLDELYAVCDRVTIMRDGRTIEQRPLAEISRYELVAKMLGRELAQELSHRRAESATVDQEVPPALAARGLRRDPELRNVSLDVRPGEIVGLAGLLGSGRTETARALFGADALDAGEVVVGGKPAAIHSPRDAVRNKLGLVPEDRKTDGIVPYLSVAENLTLALLPRLRRHGIVDRSRQQAIVKRFVEALGIKCSSADQPIRELSGGNQQKVILARWLCTDPRLLILDEPTRGIDVGAKADIQLLIRKLADDGLGVLFISSELEEVVAGCDRVITLRDGASVSELRGEEISEAALMTAMATGAAVAEDER
ncbi:MAG: galactofuranose transport system ATP-binding protein [Gaiellaceae bacterium]|jgi:ribose transport system ATP-binding protein|nr:galactofuranose transport system ATP-binding protein [Gaiellaceae bacterium]